MKKNLLRIVCILMALFMLPVHAFAAEQAGQEEALTGAAAINYVQKNADFVGSEYRTVTTSQNNRLEFRVDTYTKTEPVGLTRSGAAEYATTTYEVWNTRASGTLTDNKYDPTASMLVSLTVYFTQYHSDSQEGRMMTRVSGSYTAVGYGVEMRSQNYSLYARGTGFHSGLPIWEDETYSLSASQRSWSATVNNNLFPSIMVGPDIGGLSATYNYTVSYTESGDTWSYSLPVEVI